MNGNVYINHGHGKKDKFDNDHRSRPKMKQIDEDIPDYFDFRTLFQTKTAAWRYQQRLK